MNDTTTNNKIYLYNDDNFDWSDVETAQADQEFEWEYLEDTIKSILKDHYMIATGTLGLWNGRVSGGKVIAEWKDFLSMLEEYTEVYIEDGEIKVEVAHHDGRNYFTCRLLTKRGEEYYCRNKDDLSRQELCERLAKAPYSKTFSKLLKDMGIIE